MARLKHALALALPLPPCHEAPRRLHRAMYDAVFPGGRRIRARLALAVTHSMPAGTVDADLVLRAACSLELVYCASQVRDGLPTFTDASLQPGRPSLHLIHGEPTAVLVGDALITLAFQLLSAPCEHPERALRISRRLAMATGSRFGIVGGHALESEGDPAATWLQRGQHLKTAPLFRLVSEMGALASGMPEPDGWAAIGHWLGAAYELAEDLHEHGLASTPSRDPAARGPTTRPPGGVAKAGHIADRTMPTGGRRSSAQRPLLRRCPEILDFP